ncbi:MAG: hypothetical protein B7Z16_01920 [Algoriphagus sp. 32-45-6]|nr:MAG: hypothetical protein B7Z16_01920 [Algoriphagus sp. 32-45-6]
MNKIPVILLFFGWFLGSCSEPKTKINESVQDHPIDSAMVESTQAKVTFFQYEDSSSHPDAILELFTPLGNQSFRPGKVPFEFNIKNFDLNEGGSDHPQLFLILNGGDPVGFFSPIFQRELAQGTYRAVAFLVDEEGLALKNFGNYVDRDFLVGDSRPFPYSAEPYLAINLPRNQQIVTFGEDVILDFLVLGGDMDLDDLKVKVELNSYSYEVEKMLPIRISNLPKGDYQLTIRLLRKNNQELEGPFSSVSKAFYVR